jgi:hypothetical protein
VLPAFESKTSLVSLIMVTTGEESYHLVQAMPISWVLAEKGNLSRQPRAHPANSPRARLHHLWPAMTRDEKQVRSHRSWRSDAGGTGALLEVGDGSGRSFAKLMAGYPRWPQLCAQAGRPAGMGGWQWRAAAVAARLRGSISMW